MPRVDLLLTPYMVHAALNLRLAVHLKECSAQLAGAVDMRNCLDAVVWLLIVDEPPLKVGEIKP